MDAVTAVDELGVVYMKASAKLCVFYLIRHLNYAHAEKGIRMIFACCLPNVVFLKPIQKCLFFMKAVAMKYKVANTLQTLLCVVKVGNLFVADKSGH